MDALSIIAEIIKDLLIFVVVMFALLIALIVIVSKMPEDNPLKRVLTALSYRIGATAAAGLLAIPIEPIPGLDVLYDIGVSSCSDHLLDFVFQERKPHHDRSVFAAGPAAIEARRSLNVVLAQAMATGCG
jgi:hypothetical protein